MSKKITVFKTWKTIKLGTGLKTADDFRKALKKAGFEICNFAGCIIDQASRSVSSEEKEVELVVVSVEELGFNCAHRGMIYVRAKRRGLGICPAEVGLQLPLQYKDRRKGKFLYVGMEPIVPSSRLFKTAVTFRVGRSEFTGDQMLTTEYIRPNEVYYGSDRWVFLLHKKPSH